MSLNLFLKTYLTTEADVRADSGKDIFDISDGIPYNELLIECNSLYIFWELVQTAIVAYATFYLLFLLRNILKCNMSIFFISLFVI